MTNATQENPQDQTDAPEVRPIEGQAPTADELVAAVQALQDERDELRRRLGEIGPIEGHAAVISRRPSWADRTTMGAEVITHSWTAPTVAMVLEAGHEELTRAPVELYRDDDLLVHDDVVAVHEGPWRIFLLDTAIEDIVNARRLAAAILECCDRIDQADQQS